MNAQKIVYSPKNIIVAILVMTGVIIIIAVAVSALKRKKQQKKQEELLKETVNPNSAGSKAVQLESLIFARKTPLYGWEPDKEGILRFFAGYGKTDVDKVLEAYAILYPPSRKKGFGILSTLVPASALIGNGKDYKGSAFADLENISDRETFDLIAYAYSQLK